MPNAKKFVSTLTICAALTGGMLGLGAATTITGANAATTVTKGGGGDYRDWSRHRNRNRNWNRSFARSWARNWARHLNHSLSRSANVNRQAQSINIRLVFPSQLGTPVSATATSTPSTTSMPATITSTQQPHVS
ncbi:hypothetical protein [Sphaerisporangium rhizosphaerae]|uniref:Uncharacterized protein n=1 Tax=Sphaerisporangium rhizosphaerae TaxID=2269375 RepID=A0ABW2P2P6_9ACTN